MHITAAIFTGVKSDNKADPRSRDEHALQHYLGQAQPAQRRPRPGNV